MTTFSGCASGEVEENLGLSGLKRIGNEEVKTESVDYFFQEA